MGQLWRFVAPSCGVLAAAVGFSACSSGPVASKDASTTTRPPASTVTAGPPLPAGTPPAPEVLLGKVRRAIASQVGVHVHAVTTTNQAPASRTLDDDLGVRTGIERLTSAGARLEVRVTLNAAYLFGNAAGLSQFLGLPSSVSVSNPQAWYEVRAGTSEYNAYKKDATIPSTANYLPTNQRVFDNRTNYGGQTVYELQWSEAPVKNSLAITLYLNDTTYLPIAEVASAKGVSENVRFSKWGESVIVPIPSPVLPLSALFGRTPSP